MSPRTAAIGLYVLANVMTFTSAHYEKEGQQLAAVVAYLAAIFLLLAAITTELPAPKKEKP